MTTPHDGTPEPTYSGPRLPRRVRRPAFARDRVRLANLMRRGVCSNPLADLALTRANTARNGVGIPSHRKDPR